MTTGCTGNATVSTSTAGAVTTASGGSLALSGLSLTIPTAYSATTTSANFQIKKLDSTAFFASAGNPTGKNRIGTNVFNLKALIDATTTLPTFSNSLTVSLTYAPSDVAGVDPTTLKIYRFDGSVWNSLSGCSVDTSNHIVSCQTSNFSDFGLFGDPLPVVIPVASPSHHGGSFHPSYLPTQTTNSGSPATTAQTTITAKFTSDLFLGTNASYVILLQNYLNTHGFIVAKSGAGSQGKETAHFGSATKAALIKFQKAKGISPAVGYFGPVTRKYILSH